MVEARHEFDRQVRFRSAELRVIAEGERRRGDMKSDQSDTVSHFNPAERTKRKEASAIAIPGPLVMIFTGPS
jgi:hypothetical protein